MTLTIVALSLIHTISPAHAQTAARVDLSSSATLDAPATAGYFQLEWKASSNTEEDSIFIVEQDISPDFSGAREIYRGRDEATTISGLPDGVYHFRARVLNDTAPPATLSVRVEHHPLSRALLFLLLGLVVFICTALLIARGDRESRA